MSLEFLPGNIYFALELLFAELIFLYPAPRRAAFCVRLGLSMVVLSAIAGFLPWLPYPGLLILPYVLRSILLFCLAIAAAGSMFYLRIHMLFSMCVAGYAVQHIAYRMTWLITQTSWLPNLSLGGISRDRIIEIVVVCITYFLAFLTFGQFSAKNECYKTSDPKLDAIALVIVFICVVMSRFPRVFGEDHCVTGSIYAVLCCWLALFIQFNLHQMVLISNEKQLIEHLQLEDRKQYEISESTIASINIKIHDAKHKLAAYHGKLPSDEIESLKRDIDIYDSVIKVGNQALDVLLTEKNNKCQQKGIHLTCTGDGGILSFMKTMDIYSLFGNAVDNAIEAVDPLKDEKKLIDISIEQRGNLVFLSFSNYFDGVLELQDGLPQTTKTEEVGYHGYGMKSMRLIAAKYDGELSVTTRGELFHLNIYLQIPET